MTCNKRHHLVNIESTTIASCLWKFVTSRAINFHSFNIKVCWGIKTETNFSRGKKLYNRGAKLDSVSFNLLNWKTLYMILCHGRNYSFCLSMMSTVILENSVRNVITMLWTNKIFLDSEIQSHNHQSQIAISTNQYFLTLVRGVKIDWKFESIMYYLKEVDLG